MDISLSELTPEALHGYGSIDAKSAADLGAVVTELRGVCLRGRQLLRPREGEQLAGRLAEIAGPLGDILRRAEALTRDRGLVEVRPLIAAAAERAGAAAIEVGIFGRVSSGKSSLINALIGAPLLPVGATPVTAVPLRLVHGDEDARVLFADGREELVETNRLADFATEGGNPDNIRGVRSVLIHTPQIPDGLALLDTPGVGSLRLSGPAQSFAWLPRCDVGVVLVSAGTPVGEDELALVRGLAQAGIAIELLMSKSDLLPAADRATALAYVANEMERATGVRGLPVRAVSVTEPDRGALDAWRHDAILQRVAGGKKVANVALARRLRALIGALDGALVARLGLDLRVIDRQRARLQARAAIAATADNLALSAPEALEFAAVAAATAWRGGTDAGVAARAALLEPPSAALARMRDTADVLLAGTDGSPRPADAGRIPPIFDPPCVVGLPIADEPSILEWARPLASARRSLRVLGPALAEAYGTYAERVRAWAMARADDRFERLAEAPSPETGHVAPELQSLATLIDQYFPESGL
jgi:GTP-binding protein EngB required for normal cell division